MWIKRLLILLTILALSAIINFQVFVHMSANSLQTNSIIVGAFGLVLLLLGRHMNKMAIDKSNRPPLT